LDPIRKTAGWGNTSIDVSENVKVAKAGVDIYNGREVDTFFPELATPDFEWFPITASSVKRRSYRGRRGVRALLRGHRRRLGGIAPLR
jgi:hypothetical protein